MGANGNKLDLTNQRFGYLVALRPVGSTRRGVQWACRCDCGVELIVGGWLLRGGKKKACCVAGHKWRSDYYDRNPGLTRLHSKEYSVFRGMWDRCVNKKNDSYKDYGGRGIKVCERWREFKNFFEDMGKRPTDRHTLDRFPDNNGNYEPGNCRWATPDEQRRNMRSSVYVNYDGNKVLLLDLVEKLKLNRGVVYGRLKNGWKLEDALTVAVRPKKKNRMKKAGR